MWVEREGGGEVEEREGGGEVEGREGEEQKEELDQVGVAAAPATAETDRKSVV